MKLPALKIIALTLSLGLTSTAALAQEKGPNYHAVGWANTLVPGAGSAWMGHWSAGFFQASYEIGSFWAGYRLSEGAAFSLDGFTSKRPEYRGRRGEEISINHRILGDMLQEVGLKAHMLNTFEAYRLAAKRNSSTGELPPEIDGTSTGELFLEPFKAKNLSDPWVYFPIAATLAYVTADYLSQTSGTIPRVARLSPGSNFLYTVNYAGVQPFGSGAPEEMFFRGFLQNEFHGWTGTPWLAVPMSTAIFALAHAPGDGRISAAAAGGYLGYLAHRFGGRLGPSITVHFWSNLLLGVETILLNHQAQRTTPPASFNIQINF